MVKPVDRIGQNGLILERGSESGKVLWDNDISSEAAGLEVGVTELSPVGKRLSS